VNLNFQVNWSKGPRMNLRLISKLACATVLIALSACVPPPQAANPSVFAQRAPPAGRPTYLETIKYIDDGMRYIDPITAFFVSSEGMMCFRGVFNYQPGYIHYISDWCLPPTAVSEVASHGSYELRLSCKHENPQCVHEIGRSNLAANTISVQAVPARQEKTAVEHLIYLMGGDLGDAQPFAARRRDAATANTGPR
jgi:hypothetical protein